MDRSAADRSTRALALAFALRQLAAGRWPAPLAGLSTARSGWSGDTAARVSAAIRTPEERRERELLALGLIAAGVVCFVVSLAIG